MSIPELELLAVTRGAAGAGAGLLLANRLPRRKRKWIAIPLIAVGVLSTVPLLIDIVRKARNDSE